MMSARGAANRQDGGRARAAAACMVLELKEGDRRDS
jgi:hypothetical protein